MKPAVIIGYGNPLRQDDGIGRRAAELLEEKLPPGAADVTCCHQLTPELAAILADAPVVLFLDAAVDQTSGLVLYRSVSPHHLGSASHHLSPEQLLDLALTMNGDAPRAFLITGGIQRIDIGDALSPAAERCAARMADVALDLMFTALEQRLDQERQGRDNHNSPQEILAFLEKFASHMRPGCRSEDHANLHGDDGLPR